MKRIPKILKLIFVLIFVFQLIGLAVLFAWPEITQAADINFKPQITIPGFDTEAKNAGMKGSETSGYSIDGNAIGVLIKSIYKYAIGIVGILAAIVMMIGGFMWLIAGGNQSKISEAQEWIKASLTGLVLALGSYMILATVNPALVELKPITIKKIGDATTGCCDNKGGNILKKDCGTNTWYSGTGMIYNVSTKKCETSISVVETDCNKRSEKECTGDCKLTNVVADGASLVLCMPANASTYLDYCTTTGHVGDSCKMPSGANGYCANSACNVCKPAGAACNGIILLNGYECCSKNCQDNPGVGTGNSCT